jgi:hypothetical protein
LLGMQLSYNGKKAREVPSRRSGSQLPGEGSLVFEESLQFAEIARLLHGDHQLQAGFLSV